MGASKRNNMGIARKIPYSFYRGSKLLCFENELCTGDDADCSGHRLQTNAGNPSEEVLSVCCLIDLDLGPLDPCCGVRTL